MRDSSETWRCEIYDYDEAGVGVSRRKEKIGSLGESTQDRV
jgi:hypothetical protein